MQLKEQYRTAQLLELYRSNYAFNPDEHIFYTDDVKNFQKPNDFDDWEVQKLDLSAYGKKRFKELKITEANNKITLLGGKNLAPDEQATQEILSINKRGDIEILQFSLHRKVYTVPEGKTERYVYQTRLHPWHEHIASGKYDFGNATNAPFWSPELIELFEEKKEVDYLVITEGQIKARKACIDGIPTVGLTSISHFKKSGKIHGEIIEFINTCKVKKLIILWDGDCRDISLKSLESNEDISKRPNLFFQFAIKIKSLVHELVLPKKLHIYFATINSSEITDNPKGIDDLLITLDKKTVVSEFAKIGILPSQILDWYSIQNEQEIRKLRKFFHLHSEQEFYQFHAEKIRSHDFIYFGSTFKVESGKPIIQVSAKIKEYKRIGPDYFRLINDGVYDDDGEMVSSETVLVPWKVGEIQRDHGKDVTKHIERYDAFTNVASHVNYQQIVDNKWNLYNDINHEITPGEWGSIQHLLKHIFQNQYEMALDYMQLLYTKPYQKLPVLCLVSKEEGTGKSTFMQLLQMIFQNNMATVSSEDIMGSWTSHWVSKLIVGSEETFFEKKEALDKIKNLSTADSVMRSERFVNNKMIPCILKFVFCSNHEDDFIKLNSNSSRFWVIKVNPIPPSEKNTEMKSMMQREIPQFLSFLLNRELVNKKQDRMWFGLDQIITDAFKNVVTNSEPGPIKELRLKLQDSFLKWNQTKIELTAEDIRQYLGIKPEANYLNKIIRQYLNVTRKTNGSGIEIVTTYSFIVNDAADATKPREIKDKGRPFVFHRADFVPAEMEHNGIQSEIEFDYKVTEYKFRAECQTDAMKFFELLPSALNTAKIDSLDGETKFPDVIVLFECNLSLEDIRNLMREVEDSHVMLQTVALADNYTGERNYEIN